MTTVFANELELWLMPAVFILFVVWHAFNTKLRLAVIRGDKAVSGYELGKNYRDREIFRMHEALFGKSWMRWFSKILFGILLLGLIPLAVLWTNDLFHNNLLHLISKGR